MKLAEFSLEGAIINVSPTFCDLLGYAESDLLGQHHSLLITDEYRQSDTYRMFWVRLKQGQGQKEDIQLVKSDGSTVTFKGEYELEISSTLDSTEEAIVGLYDSTNRQDVVKAAQNKFHNVISEITAHDDTPSGAWFDAETTIQKTLDEICRNIPRAWQYPEHTVARITFADKEYVSTDSHFTADTPWVQQQVFETIDDRHGIVEVFYTHDFPLRDEGPFLKSERQRLNNIASLLSGFLNIVIGIEHTTLAQSGIERLLAAKTDHKKSLACLYEVSQILKQGKSVDDTLKAIAMVLPHAWQFSEYAICRIRYDNHAYTYPPEDFMGTQWIQRQVFKTIDFKKGAIEIYYLKEFPNSDEGPFTREERKLINNLAVLVAGYINVMTNVDETEAVKQSLSRMIAEKEERLKEITVINQATQIINEGASVADTLARVCHILPSAFQFPELAAVRIRYDDNVYTTANFNETRWSLRKQFVTIDNKKGRIDVFYLKYVENLHDSPFLKDERLLIDSLANLLVSYFNRLKWKDLKDKKKKEDIGTAKGITRKDGHQIMVRRLLQSFLNKIASDKNVYHDLMKFRVREILLVSTPYDAYILENEDRFFEQSLGEVYNLNLASLPRITGATSADEALDLMETRRFDLVVIMMGADKEKPLGYSRQIKDLHPSVPIFLLLNNNRDIAIIELQRKKLPSIDKVFVWNGDSKIFFAMVRLLEDKVNVDNDTKIGMVRVMLLIEDSAQYYSRYLPLLYSIVFEQTQQVITELNTDELNKISRMKTRPKILLAHNYEEAQYLFNTYRDYMLCVISDVSFPRHDVQNEEAGIEFIKYVRQYNMALPTLIQSSDGHNQQKAYELSSTFINKNSETLLQDLRNFLTSYLGFGHFIYRNKMGEQIGIARTMKEFEAHIATIPEESLMFHALQDHFSSWLMARGEIQIAKILRPVKTTDFNNPEGLRQYILQLVGEYKRKNNMGKVVNFDETSIIEETNVVSIGTGTLGGKGRGLSFINALIYKLNIEEMLPNVRIRMPRTSIIGTDEFDAFLQINNIQERIKGITDYIEIKKIFLDAKLSTHLTRKIRRFLKLIKSPLAVRSSSLFEDSLIQPFSGLYDTFLLPNNNPSFEKRVLQVCDAVKMVYASIYSHNALTYFKAVNYQVEQEKMAVVLQEVVGQQFGNYFYPHLSGTAQSYNYYPVAQMKPEEGVAVIALGLGKYVMGGEQSFRFSPRYPKVLSMSPRDAWRNSQNNFYAIDISDRDPDFLNEGEDTCLARLDLATAERHGSLRHCASVYDRGTDRLIPNLDIRGPRVVNFANILQYEYIPLARTLEVLLDVLKEAMGMPIEIEYSVNLTKDETGRASFYLLQVKPLVGTGDDYNIDTTNTDMNKVVLYTASSMGNGRIDNITDVIYAHRNRFDKLRTQEMAAEIDQLNALMMAENRRYLLIGPGRWGTRDRFLGIPVTWPQISNAKVVVEISLEDFPLEASLGSHFFHNVTSMDVGYFSVQSDSKHEFINWEMLEQQTLINETHYFRHVRFDAPLTIRMDGRKRIAIVNA